MPSLPSTMLMPSPLGMRVAPQRSTLRHRQCQTNRGAPSRFVCQAKHSSKKGAGKSKEEKEAEADVAPLTQPVTVEATEAPPPVAAVEAPAAPPAVVPSSGGPSVFDSSSFGDGDGLETYSEVAKRYKDLSGTLSATMDGGSSDDEEVPMAPRPGPSVFDTDSFGEGDSLEPFDAVAARYEARVAGSPLANADDGPLVTDTIDEKTEELMADVDAMAESVFRQAAVANGGAPRVKTSSTPGADPAVAGGPQLLDEAEENAQNLAKRAETELDKGVDQGAEILDEAQGDVQKLAARAETELDKRVDEGAEILDQAQEDVEQFLDEAGKETEAQLDKAVEAGAEVLDDLELNARKAAKQIEKGMDQAVDDLADGMDAVALRLEASYAQASAATDEAIDRLPENVGAAVREVQSGLEQSFTDAQQRFDSFRDDFEAGGGPAPFASTPLTSLPLDPPADADKVEYAKRRLLYSVAGLDRGFAANAGAVDAVEAAVGRLLAAGGPQPVLSWTAEGGKPSTLQLLDGRWRLLYSSGFATGGLGGQQPGPPAALLPITIGQVFQVISTYTSRLDNVVEFYGKYGLPELPFLGIKQEPIVATLSLRHSFEAPGGPTVRITFEDTDVKATGGINGVLGRLPSLSVPSVPDFLRPPRDMRSSTFDVLFLDNDLRVTRGNRGELRVFTRV